jgi:hypothetical protein
VLSFQHICLTNLQKNKFIIFQSFEKRRQILLYIHRHKLDIPNKATLFDLTRKRSSPQNATSSTRLHCPSPKARCIGFQPFPSCSSHRFSLINHNSLERRPSSRHPLFPLLSPKPFSSLSSQELHLNSEPPPFAQELGVPTVGEELDCCTNTSLEIRPLPWRRSPTTLESARAATSTASTTNTHGALPSAPLSRSLRARACRSP